MLDPDLPKLKEELVPYDFDVRPQSPSKPPPHWLLLDHTIAVLWILHNQDHRKDKLNIEQLKRAHGFLKGVRNDKGDNPKDIKKSLNLIEDKMIASYAGLTMESKDNNKKGRKEKVSPLEITIISKADPEMFAALKMEEEKSKVATQKVENESENKIESKKENNDTTLYKEKINSDVFPIPVSSEKVSVKKGRKLNQKSETDFNEYIEKLLEKRTANNLYWNSKLENDRKLSKNSIPSIISHHSSKHKKTSKKIRFAAVTNSSNLHDLKKKKENSKASEDGDMFPALKAGFQCLTTNPDISNEELMDFLKQWRTEQVDRIQLELKRLNSIEELMKNINMDDFEPFMENGVVEKLQKISSPQN